MNNPLPLSKLSTTYVECLDNIKDDLVAFLKNNYLHNQMVDMAEIERQHVYGRSQFFINTILPWVNAVHPLHDLDIVEIGPGTGSISAPLGFVARSVASYDISHISAGVAKFRCERLGLSNVTINIDSPENLLGKLKKDHETKRPSLVVLFATLEHMKIGERIETIRTCWDILADDGLLLVADTPNRLSYLHGHTSRYPFFDMVPDELMVNYSDKSPNKAFADAVGRWREDQMPMPKISERLDRWGRGVSFHEFEVAIGQPVSDKIVGSGLDRGLVKSMPLLREEILLMRFMNTYLPDMSLSFGRASLYFVLKKGVCWIPWEESFTRQILNVS